MKTPISSKINNKILKVLNTLLGVNKTTPGCVLCYHSISDNGWEYSISPKMFERQLEYLATKRKVVSLCDMTGSNDLEGKVAITFDDGYEDIFKNALPILKKYNLPACVFVVGDRDNVDRNQLGSSKKLLCIDQIKKLKKFGWGIGYHTKTHKNLVNLNKKGLQDELIDGKKELENKLGFSIKYFAYPHGKYSEKVVDVVKKAGFDTAFTIDGGAVLSSTRPFKYNRVTVDKYLKLENFGVLLTRRGLLYNSFHTRILKVKDSILDFV